jgi:uncharacterized protein YqeY
MPLKSRLDDDLKDAMRSGDRLRRSVIRLLRAAIKNEEIEVRRDLDDAGVVDVLTRQVKQRRDSIEAFTQGGRHDMADKEQAEVAVILEYLPRQMDADEIAALVRQAIDETGAAGPADMGRVMGRVMPQVRGRAQGGQVSAIASRLLRGGSD